MAYTFATIQGSYKDTEVVLITKSCIKNVMQLKNTVIDKLNFTKFKSKDLSEKEIQSIFISKNRLSLNVK